MVKNEEFQKWLNDDRYVRPKDLKALWSVNQDIVKNFLYTRKIRPVKTFGLGRWGGNFYDKQQCISARAIYLAELQELQKCLSDINIIQSKELALNWGIRQSNVSRFLSVKNIKPIKTFNCGPAKNHVFYDRAECERARPFINQPEKKEVEKVNLPEPKEQTPDIIPADTIDLFTMSELESELKNRGVELTAEVRAKINASDMPEMQHIATMLRGNAKSIAIRLSVLNEIAGRLSNNSDCVDKKEHIIAEAELLSIDDVRVLLHRFNIDSHTFKSTNADVYKYARQGIGDCPDFLFFNGKRMWKRSDIMNWIETLSKRTTFYNAQIKRIESNIDLIQMKADLERKIAKLHGMLYSMEESLQDLLSDITEFKNYTAR